MKTIFYKESEDANGDYWFNSKPYKEWFTLENTLYEHDGNIQKYTIVPDADKKYRRGITTGQIHDVFSDDGIIRRIQLNISKY